MTETSDLGADLDTLVRQMVKDAAKEGVALDERAKVLKMASQHHMNMVKLRGMKRSDGDHTKKPGTPDMSDLRNRLSDETPGTTHNQPAERDDDDEQA